VAVLVDTSVLIDAERGGDAFGRVAEGERRLISVITVSELLHGVHRAVPESVKLRRKAMVEELLGAIDPLPITESVARMHSEVWAKLESEGNIIGAHDLWIAATALSHGLTLMTHNPNDFERIPGLDVLPVQQPHL
jgi:predicted nucleic acid-binding protein